MSTTAATADGLLASEQSDQVSDDDLEGGEPRQTDRWASTLRPRLFRATILFLITAIELIWLATVTYGVRKLIG